MMQKKLRGKLAALLVILLCTAACVETVLIGLGATAAIGTYKWMEGTMEKDYPRPMQEVWNASLKACGDLKLRISSQQYGALESKIEAVQPPDTTVKIQLISRPNQITTLKVRFGLMGNQDASAYFNRRVMHHLGLAAAE
ncbi:MAG: DUF3568 family protein [Deltaproteobacteria bacterium]|nr:DUF3568 family protein [Deltaproteobacteria bacterium]MBI4796169.1 DUF3568 family protein [Deltaproteobacteria bacterium]